MRFVAVPASTAILVGLLVACRRSAPVLLLPAAMLAGCTADPAVVISPTPTHAQPTATASTAPATTTPSVTPPTASPPTGPTATPGPLTVAWARAGVDAGFGDVGAMSASATFGDRFVVVGRRDAVDSEGAQRTLPAIWFSDDGFRWQPADVEDGDIEGIRIHDVTVGGPGLVAVGDEYASATVRAAVWSSTDGRRWVRVHDEGFSPGRMWHVGATDQGIVAFGDDCLCIYGQGRRVIWTSADGRDWLRATNETGLEVAKGVRTLVGADGGLTAFVHDADSVHAATRPIEVWRTSGRADWARVGELPGSEGGDLFQAAQGPRGWVATGTTGSGGMAAWTSADGIAWDVSPTAAGRVTSLLADRAGFVAVGARSTSTGCLEMPGEFVGQTWASSDGRVWREIRSEKEWVGEGISQLLQRAQTVIGVGLSYETMFSAPDGVVWTATMPTTSLEAGPLPVSTPRPSPTQGCGG
jgi:hypothetical protein